MWVWGCGRGRCGSGVKVRGMLGGGSPPLSLTHSPPPPFPPHPAQQLRFATLWAGCLPSSFPKPTPSPSASPWRHSGGALSVQSIRHVRSEQNHSSQPSPPPPLSHTKHDIFDGDRAQGCGVGPASHQLRGRTHVLASLHRRGRTVYRGRARVDRDGRAHGFSDAGGRLGLRCERVITNEGSLPVARKSYCPSSSPVLVGLAHYALL